MASLRSVKARLDATRGLKCFDCFEWRCRMSITRRRLDVDGHFRDPERPVRSIVFGSISRFTPRKLRVKPRCQMCVYPAGHTCISRRGERTRSSEEAVRIHGSQRNRSRSETANAYRIFFPCIFSAWMCKISIHGYYIIKGEKLTTN